MRLYHVHVTTKFEANLSKKHGHSGQKPPKWTLLRHNVATSLRHDVNSHIVHCVYIMSLFPSNLKQISLKTRLQWPKTPKLTSFCVISSRRHNFMTFFNMIQSAYTMSMYPPNYKQIGRKTWSESRKTYFRALPLQANIKTQKSGSITTRALAIPIMCPNMKKIG